MICRRFRENSENWLLVSPYMSVRPPARPLVHSSDYLSPSNNWARTGRISMKFNIEGFFQNLSRKLKF